MPPTESTGSLISIVDDEECVRESLSSLIRSVGYPVRDYASAEDFLTWGRWEETACLILDVRLPGMGGLELQRYMAEKQRIRPTILISGHATENEQTRAMMKGAVAFLRKPFSDEALLSAVREAVARGDAKFHFKPEPSQVQVCSLCHETARVEKIPERFVLEHGELHASTVKMIKTLNPEWAEQDGVCQRCWRFYVGLGRVVNYLRSPDEAGSESASVAGISPKG